MFITWIIQISRFNTINQASVLPHFSLMILSRIDLILPIQSEEERSIYLIQSSSSLPTYAASLAHRLWARIDSSSIRLIPLLQSSIFNEESLTFKRNFSPLKRNKKLLRLLIFKNLYSIFTGRVYFSIRNTKKSQLSWQKQSFFKYSIKLLWLKMINKHNIDPLKGEENYVA